MWHHYAGLLFGVVTLTWTYSGLLSMGPFNWFRAPAGARVERDSATGGRVRPDRLSLDGMRRAVDTLKASFAPQGTRGDAVQGRAVLDGVARPSVEEADRWMHAAFRQR
jgi:hypothetical protein